MQDVYEPGSTFKIVTASAALEEGVLQADRPDRHAIPGVITFPGRKPITEDKGHNYGVLSFEDVIVKSSNVGAIKVGLRVGAERLSRYVQRFGFGADARRRTSAGRARGIVWSAGPIDDSALASVSMGYQISVTPLQMVTAASVGRQRRHCSIEPHVVRAVDPRRPARGRRAEGAAARRSRRRPPRR